MLRCFIEQILVECLSVYYRSIWSHALSSISESLIWFFLVSFHCRQIELVWVLMSVKCEIPSQYNFTTHTHRYKQDFYLSRSSSQDFISALDLSSLCLPIHCHPLLQPRPSHTILNLFIPLPCWSTLCLSNISAISALLSFIVPTFVVSTRRKRRLLGQVVIIMHGIS